MSVFNVGWSEVSITPSKKIALGGQFAERISEYVETPITVTALAVTSGDEQMIICSCDLVSIGKNLLEKVREKIKKENNDIDTDKVIISAVHNHTSHVYYRGENLSYNRVREILNSYLPEEKQYKAKVSAKGEDFMDSKEALEFLTERIAKAVTEAWENSQTKNSGRFIGDSVFEGLKIDGKLYGFAPTRGNGCITYVKQAWLDACGLEAPTT